MAVHVENRVVEGTGPVQLAEWLVREVWTKEGKQRLWAVGDMWWEWVEREPVGRWCVREEGWVRSQVYEALGLAITRREGRREGQVVESAVMVDKKLVDYVMDVLVGMVKWWGEDRWPRWVGEQKTDPEWTVAFEDRCVDVKATAEKGEWVTVERDEAWFSPTVVPALWDPCAQCPEFDRVMKEWGQGEEGWEEASDRMYGYAMVGHRGYAKWVSEYGRVRSGKGTRGRLLRRVLGKEWVGGTLMDELVGRFGLEVIRECKVLIVDECRGIDEGRGGRMATILKAAVGMSEMQVDVKGMKAVRCVLPHLVIAVGNDPLVLPNRNMGLSSKMVPLRFGGSWLGREDWDLDEKLWRERGGVALRWCKGAVRLVQSGGRVPETGRGREMKDEFEAESAGTWGRCVKECFEPAEGWWERGDLVREAVREWEAREREVLKGRNGRPVRDVDVLVMIERECPWGVERVKRREGGENPVLGMKGLRVRRGG